MNKKDVTELLATVFWENIEHEVEEDVELFGDMDLNDAFDEEVEYAELVEIYSFQLDSYVEEQGEGESTLYGDFDIMALVDGYKKNGDIIHGIEPILLGYEFHVMKKGKIFYNYEMMRVY